MTAARPDTVRIRGRTLAYHHRAGGPGRSPLVLCNGIGAGMELFDPLVAQLDPSRPVIRFDVPGVGASPGARMPYILHQLACSVRTLVARLGYDHADVLGISWGGALAQQIAFQHPRFCRNLVLVATGTGACMIPAKPRVLARMPTPRRHRDPEYARSIAGDIYGGSARIDPDRAVASLHHSLHAPPIRGYVYQLAALGCWTSMAWLPTIRQPALVLVGDDDPIIPHINGVLMARMLGRGELHTYSGGHLTLLTEPTELVPVIEHFLDRTERRASVHARPA